MGTCFTRDELIRYGWMRIYVAWLTVRPVFISVQDFTSFFHVGADSPAQHRVVLQIIRALHGL